MIPVKAMGWEWGLKKAFIETYSYRLTSFVGCNVTVESPVRHGPNVDVDLAFLDGHPPFQASNNFYMHFRWRRIWYR